MGHNYVVSGYLKFIGISRVDGLSTGPPGFGVSQIWILLYPEIHQSGAMFSVS